VNEAWYVLQQCDSWSHLAKDSVDVGPEISGIISSSSLPCDTEWLTREAANDAIHDASPRAEVLAGEVTNDGGHVQPSFLHPTEENFLPVWVDL